MKPLSLLCLLLLCADPSKAQQWIVFGPDHPEVDVSKGGWRSLVDRHNRVWFAGGRSFLIFSDDGWNELDLPLSISPGEIVAITEDVSGTIWTGLAWEHVGVLDGSLLGIRNGPLPSNTSEWIISPPPPDSDTNSSIAGLIADSLGYVWALPLESKLGHTQDLVRFDGQHWEVNQPDSVYWYYDGGMAVTGDGSFWMVFNKLDRKALFRFRDEVWEEVGLDSLGADFLHSTFVRDIEIDDSMNVWMASFGKGILKFDGAESTHFTRCNSGLPSDSIWAIQLEANKALWVGTARGLARFDGERWDVYSTENSDLIDNDVFSIAIDHDANKWMFTYNIELQRKGIAVYNENGVVRVGSEAEVPISQQLALSTYPNPFYRTTTIRYTTPAADYTKIELFDLLGRPVMVIVEGYQPAGIHEVRGEMEGLAAGIYFLRMQSFGNVESLPIVILP